jgi:hypothetical protein
MAIAGRYWKSDFLGGIIRQFQEFTDTDLVHNFTKTKSYAEGNG